MIDLGMLGNLQILHDGTTGDNTILKMLYTKAFQRFGLEMSQEFLPCSLLGENPIIQFEGTISATEIFLKIILAGTVIEYLLRHEVAHQFLHIIIGSFASQELSGRDIQEAYTAGGFTEMDGSQEVVLLVVQHVISHRHTRSDELGNTALHHLVHLAQSLLTLYFQSFLLWVFQLVAYRHTLTCTHQFRQISIESMMRESSHLCSTSRTTVVTSGQGDAKYSGSLYRIFAVSFVEVATAEKQQCLGMLCFHLEELSHHRCKPFIVVCHYLILFISLYFVSYLSIMSSVETDFYCGGRIGYS